MSSLLNVYQMMVSPNRAHPNDIRLLQDQHNVNLHADGDGDEFLDADEEFGGRDDINVIDDVEFIDRYVD